MVVRGSCPWVSDEDVLAVICRLGMKADVEHIQHALAAGTSDPQDIDRCIVRLRQAGFVRLFYARSNEPLVRLTALGLERLQALQHNPVAPRTND
jgi:hypothetical protein